MPSNVIVNALMYCTNVDALKLAQDLFLYFTIIICNKSLFGEKITSKYCLLCDTMFPCLTKFFKIFKHGFWTIFNILNNDGLLHPLRHRQKQFRILRILYFSFHLGFGVSAEYCTCTETVLLIIAPNLFSIQICWINSARLIQFLKIMAQPCVPNCYLIKTIRKAVPGLSPLPFMPSWLICRRELGYKPRC